MPSSPLTLIHVCAATIGLISGALAMFFPKGSGLHRVAGTFFFVSMLTATGVGAYLAMFKHPNAGNVMGSTLTFYLVATAWVAAKRRDRSVGAFDWIALVFAIAVGVAGLTWGFQAAGSAIGSKDGYPPPMFFIFGSIALLFAAFDVRMLVRGGVIGAQRIARHLWRMGFAYFFTAASFYPGQAKLFSRAVRQTNLLYTPMILAIGLTLFWMVRVLMTNARKTKRSEVRA